MTNDKPSAKGRGHFDIGNFLELNLTDTND